MGVEPKLGPDPWSLMQAFATHGNYGYGRGGRGYNNSQQLQSAQDAAQDAADDAGYPDSQYSNGSVPISSNDGGSGNGPLPMMSRSLPTDQGTGSVGPASDVPLMAQGTPGDNGTGPIRVAESGDAQPDGTGNLKQRIIAAAQARGIDPSVPLKLVAGEGGFDAFNTTGDGGSSAGPFQLHRGGIAGGGNAVGGLGDTFTAKYGEPPGPNNVQKQIDFSLDYAKQHGWGPWHGYHGGQWDGIPGRQAMNDQQQDAQQDASNSDSVDPSSRLSWLA